jgi:SAM-dependent methyltransferase
LRLLRYEFYRDLIVPELRYAQALYEEELVARVEPGARWLDLGCGHGVLPPWRAAAERALLARAGQVVGIDMDWAGLLAHPHLEQRIFGSIGSLPFRDGSFDVATANMVVEHLGDPGHQFAEIARVLRPGGVFVFITPNANGYLARLGRFVPEWAKKPLIRVLEGRRAEDVFPTYYRANTRADIERLSAGTGFATERCAMVTTVPQFARILPLAILELLFIRHISSRANGELKPVLLGVLRRMPSAGTARQGPA